MKQHMLRLRALFTSRLPVIFQSEAAECGLACLAMVASYYGKHTDLLALRQRFSVSLRGATLAHLIRFADHLGFIARPLRVEMENLTDLQTPCILHWNLNHFVVLKSANKKQIIIHDPGLGLRRISHAEVSNCFTGVALELTPTPEFKPKDESNHFGLRDLTGRIVGLGRAAAHVLALAAALEVLLLVSPLFLQFAVDKVVTFSDYSLLTTLGIGFMMLIGLQAVISAVRSWSTLYFGTSLKLQWYAKIFSHLVRLPVSFFEKRSFADIMSRFDGADVIQRTLTNNFAEALLDGIISVFMLAVMFIYSRKLALIVVFTVSVYALLRAFAYRPLRQSTEQYINQMAKQQGLFIETLRGIRTIKLFGREAHRKTRWMNLLVDVTNAQVATEKLSMLLRSGSLLVFGLQSVGIVWLGTLQVLGGSLTLGMMFAFVAFKEQFDLRISTLVDRIFEFRMLSLQGQRLADILLQKPETLEFNTTAIESSSASIEVQSLHFRYSETEPWLLKNINLRIEPGECVAIVGPSGAGKSTLLKLMAGLLEPQAGDVLIEGHSVCTNRAAVLGKIGFVLQDDTLFNGTISDNISFASDIADMSRVTECARLACLDADIKAMPMGYNTLVGDMGSGLSGGQQQRLLLARALYQRPAILILDEATSHLDVPTEERIAAMLSDLKITRVFAAHRPDTIAIASRVIALSRGGFIDTGAMSSQGVSAVAGIEAMPLPGEA